MPPAARVAPYVRHDSRLTQTRHGSYSGLTPCRDALYFLSARDPVADSDKTPAPYGYAGVVALASLLVLLLWSAVPPSRGGCNQTTNIASTNPPTRVSPPPKRHNFVYAHFVRTQRPLAAGNNPYPQSTGNPAVFCKRHFRLVGGGFSDNPQFGFTMAGACAKSSVWRALPDELPK